MPDDFSQFSKLDIDEMWRDLENEIWRAFKVACPKKPCGKKATCSWWTSELSELRSEVRRLAKRQGLNSAEYKQKRNAFTKAVRIAKSAGWRNHCSSFSDIKSVASFIRRMKGNSMTDIQVIKKNDGTVTRTPRESVQTLLDTHFPNSACRQRKEYVRSAPAEEIDFINDTFTPEVVRKAFNSFQPYKTAGADGLHPIVLQHLPDDYMEAICFLFKCSLYKGYCPSASELGCNS